MKNILLGCIGALITLYTILIGLNLLSYQTQKNQLENQVSRIVKNTLEAEFGVGEESVVKQMLLQEIRTCISAEEDCLDVEIHAIDLKKGLLSVTVKKQVKLLNGSVKVIEIKKTAIVEREDLLDQS